MDENKGQNNIRRDLARQSGAAPLDLFGNSPRFAYMYRKSEKIITALYMVTSYLSDHEPLKWRMRALGGELLAETNKLKDRFSTERDELVHDLKSHVLEISSLLDIARFAGLMSDMNASLLKVEIGELGRVFGEAAGFEMNTDSLLLDKSFFDDAGNREFPSGASRRPMDGRGTSSHAPHSSQGIAAAMRGQATPLHRKTTSGTSGASDTGGADKGAGKEEKKEKRRDAILSIIRGKGEVTIKDISLSMQEVSEKTIQRELLALVEQGVLKKEGERRWSRYSINK